MTEGCCVPVAVLSKRATAGGIRRLTCLHEAVFPVADFQVWLAAAHHFAREHLPMTVSSSLWA